MTPFSVEIITLVPKLWPHLLGENAGLVGRAFRERKCALSIRDLRAYGRGQHRQLDDRPFGGGAGMVLSVEPLHQAIEAARQHNPGPVVLLSPRGNKFDQHLARRLAAEKALIFICGRFEGVDERIRDYIDEDISLGDFVLSSGDAAAWCIIDAVVRLIPGVLGNAASIQEESFSQALLEYPQYTRPVQFNDATVPTILRSGDHQAIANWRQQQSEEITKQHRPDLWQLYKKKNP